MTTPDTVIAQVTEAVRRYEQALASNDLDVLDELFLDSPATVRADATGVLVGHAQISAFRRGRGGAPARDVVGLHVVVVSPDAATAIAETLRPDGTRGLQTQTWVRTPAGWRVAAAHVSADVRSKVAGATWRVHGTPLVKGSGAGPLAGVRVAVKDLFAVAGHATGAGNPGFLAEQSPQPAHAPVVAALLAAGADLAGIAQTDEFAYSLAGRNVHSGSPVNPAAPGRLTGGSSSGPAAAVAAGQAELGLGTDTAGSVRVPASYCGLFSLRPTHGALDDGGLLPLAPSFDTVGFLAGSAELLDRAAAVFLPPADLPTRVLVATDLLALTEPGVADRLHAAAARFDPAPVELTTAAEREEWFAAFRVVQAAEAWAQHGAWVTAHPGAIADDVAGRFAVAAQVTAEQHAAARATVDGMRATLRDRVPPGTVVLMPAASGPAPFVGAGGAGVEASRAATLRLTSLASGAGLPAVVVPAGRVDGAPVGLCLLGGAGADRGLTGLAVQR